MKKALLFLSVLTIQYGFPQGTWIQKANFPAAGRQHPFSFSIGNKGYVGGGENYDGTTLYDDFWEYNPATNAWSQKATFPALYVQDLVGFSINGKGYAGGLWKEFWEYNPVGNSWTQKAIFGGSSIGLRTFPAGFSIGNKGYIGTGYSGVSTSYLNDFWEYNQTTNSWTQKSNFPGTSRAYAVGFSINGKGYLFGGNAYSTYFKDIWEFDPALNIWKQKASLSGSARNDAAAFTICNSGYVGSGGETPYYNDFYKFDPVANQWIRKADFPGHARDDAAFFSIGNKGYIGLGEFNNATSYLDFYEYNPDSNLFACSTTSVSPSVNEWNEPVVVLIYPNPAREKVIINCSLLKVAAALKIFNVIGEEVYQSETGNLISEIDVQGFARGIYIVEVNDGSKNYRAKFIRE